MNKHTQDILEFEKILDLLRDKCATEIGREKIGDITQSFNIDY